MLRMRKEILPICAVSLWLAGTVNLFAQTVPPYEPSADNSWLTAPSPVAAPDAQQGNLSTDEINDIRSQLFDGQATQQQVDAFNQAAPGLMPMTPEMIEQLRALYDRNQEAILSRPAPDPIVDADLVSLEPGAPPPTFSVAPGVASVLSFFDASGQPWPIEGYVVGDEESFQILRLGEEQNNFITITPRSPVGWTNLVVSLEGQSTPVVMTVRIDRERAHYRRDVQVMAFGPNAVITPVTSTSGPRPGDSELLSFLSSTGIPEGARQVQIEGVDARGWVHGETLYVRSKLALISPSWTDSMSGPDGVRIYRLAVTPVVMFSDDGRVVRARVSLP